ncbi:MAG: arginine deiminase [bacterium]|nr:arginine deiminase [bacterium]
MSHIRVTSEIGKLKKVVLHRPGAELENLTPKWLEQLLFDDIPWLELAIKEHDAFAQTLRDAGVEVLYLADLVSETLDSNPLIKDQFIKQFIKESHVTSETLANVLNHYLHTIPSTKQMVEKTMGGIQKKEIPGFIKRTLSDHIRDYPFVTDPMPNLYFTRDPFASIIDGIAISKMYTITRARETIYGEYIFTYHPVYGNKHPRYYDRSDVSTIEGGDILVLSSQVIAVGVSERTHPAAIEKLAKNLMYKYPTKVETILAFDIPKSRSFMHLDTVFTQVDVGTFTIHQELIQHMTVYECTKDPKNHLKLVVKPIHEPLKTILERYLHVPITLIPCGGDDVVSSDREQWNDGANTLCIAPGEVIVYQRNHITNRLLAEHGILVHAIPSSELSRGRGGPRCMSMPLEREDLS